MLQFEGNQTATSNRKQEHVALCINENVGFSKKTTGFERYSFVHNALPELNFHEISTDTTLLGKQIHLPLMISCMTGGFEGALEINEALAATAEQFGIAIGVGSQKQALENEKYHETFSVMRKNAPTVPVVGNIGGNCLTGKFTDIEKIIRLIDADALSVHLNPLQELMQPEGNPCYRGVLAGIERLAKLSPIPIIVKEVGAGINSTVGKKLLDIGVAAIDCAGAGGTSWAGVEILRQTESIFGHEHESREYFWDWGIPTAECIKDLATLKRERQFTLIGSGGVSNGIDMAKALALGADITASARPLLFALHKGGIDMLEKTIQQWQLDLRRIMFLTGTPSIANFSTNILSAF